MPLYKKGELVMQIDAILFDMDGILIDTEIISKNAFITLTNQYGFKYIDNSYEHILGTTTEKSREICLKNYGETFPYEKIMYTVYDWVFEAVKENRLPLKKGVYECLDILKSKYKLALATSTARSAVEIYQQHIPKLYPYFDVIVCGDEIINSKPAPDIYLEACKKLEVSPKNCIGIEDSKNGLISLRNAGIKTVMIPDLLPFHSSFKEHVDFCIEDLTKLPKLLTEIENNN